MKRVLIVTYYWPPTGGGGVQRWLKFAKYLPEFGWKPVVYTPSNPDFEIRDESLLADIDPVTEIIRKPIWEPFGIYRKLMGAGAVQKQGVVEKNNSSVFGRLAVWIRANWFIPDPRKFWVKPSVRFLTTYLAENPVDMIVTTGPPHSMHLIGLGVTKSHQIPWVADFRDPWSDWDVLDLLQLSKRSRKKHQALEARIFQNATMILTVSWRLAEQLQKTGRISRVEVVTNGFDEADFRYDRQRTEKFRVAHLGLLNAGRNPTTLWRVLDELCLENEEFHASLELFLAGTIESEVRSSINQFKKLSKCTTCVDYMDHSEIFNIYASSSLLLLMVNKTSNSQWIIPAKLYEYLHTGLPILALGELESDANKVLEMTGNNSFLDYEDHQGMKTQVLQAWDKFKNNEVVSVSGNSQFSRRSLTMSLVSKLEPLTSTKSSE